MVVVIKGSRFEYSGHVCKVARIERSNVVYTVTDVQASDCERKMGLSDFEQHLNSERIKVL